MMRSEQECTITSKIFGFNLQQLLEHLNTRKIKFIAKPPFEGRATKTKELELSRKIERRLEMIHAHTKLGKTPFSVYLIPKSVLKDLITKPATMLHP